MKRPAIYFDTAYAAVYVRLKGENVSYSCEPRPPSGAFWCGHCTRRRVQTHYRWRCACGARVVGAVPRWMVERRNPLQMGGTKEKR